MAAFKLETQHFATVSVVYEVTSHQLLPVVGRWKFRQSRAASKYLFIFMLTGAQARPGPTFTFSPYLPVVIVTRMEGSRGKEYANELKIQDSWDEESQVVVVVVVVGISKLPLRSR